MEKDIEFIKRFGEFKIAVVGDILLDSYLYGKIERLNPESAAPLLTIEDGSEEWRLGGAGNVAMNLRSLGAEVDLYGSIGPDDNGKKVRDLCDKENIKLIVVNEGCTIKKQRFIEKSNFHYMIRIDFGESNLDKISNDGERKLLASFLDNLHEYNAVILSDYNKRILRGELGKEIITVSNDKGILSVVDPKPSNNFMNFKGASVVRPNLSEAKKIVGRKDLELMELAKALKDKMEAKYTVITCGAEGIVTYGETFHQIPTQARKVSDVSGAGDTVAAVLTLGLLSGADIIKSAELANHAAGIVVEKQGTATTTKEELIKRISKK